MYRKVIKDRLLEKRVELVERHEDVIRTPWVGIMRGIGGIGIVSSTENHITLTNRDIFGDTQDLWGW